MIEWGKRDWGLVSLSNLVFLAVSFLLYKNSLEVDFKMPMSSKNYG